MTELRTMSPIERKARAHLGACLHCMATAIRYHEEIRQALAGVPLPDQLASKMRAGFCKAGAAILDEILGVDP